MTSQSIRVLLQPPDGQASQEKALLLLDSRFQTVEELDELDAAVEQALGLRDILQQRLSESQSRVDTLIARTRTSAKDHLHSAQELSLLRHSITDEMSYLSGELVSSGSGGEEEPTMLEHLETSHRNLKELELLRGYVQLIEHALRLSESAVQQMKTCASAALISADSISEYRQLEEFLSKVTQTCSHIEEISSSHSLNLINVLEQVRQKTWTDMKAVLSSSLLAASERLDWPMPVDYMAASPDDRKMFETAFSNLLKLQELGEKSRPPQEAAERDGLYPIQALVQPVSLRFKYHFEGTRQTNRLDKPDWYFTHVLNIAHEQRHFMETIIQDLLKWTEYQAWNAWREFVLLLLPMLTRKLKRTIPSLLPHPSLLAHTIYQSLIFDAALLEEGFSIAGTSASPVLLGKNKDSSYDAVEKWAGISDVILGRKEWFEAWMEGERKFADDQYHEIISAADAWAIADDHDDHDGPVDRDSKTTNSARKIKALVEQVTDRYSPLPHYNQRTRFLVAVQLPILEQYHARISSSLDAFETLSSALMRAVPGALAVSFGSGGSDAGRKADTRRLTSGVDGVQRLCKALVSAKVIERAMEGWGEELFFLELWTEINRRAALRANAEIHATLPNPRNSTTDEVPDNTIFEELILLYRGLATRAEQMIVRQVCGEIEEGLKTHFASVLSPDPASRQPEATILHPTLLGPIAILSADLKLLRSIVPQTTLMVLYRRVAFSLAKHIFEREIIYREPGRLSSSDGREIAAECALWVEACHAALAGAVDKARVEAPWLSLMEAGVILQLEGEKWDLVVDTTFGMCSDEKWEEVMLDVVGSSELGREKVGKVLRVRQDCKRAERVF